MLHRGQKRIILSANDKLCHQHSISESPVARYASLDIGIPLRLEPSFMHVQPAARGRYHHLWPGFHRVCRSANSQYQTTCSSQASRLEFGRCRYHEWVVVVGKEVFFFKGGWQARGKGCMVRGRQVARLGVIANW